MCVCPCLDHSAAELPVVGPVLDSLHTSHRVSCQVSTAAKKVFKFSQNVPEGNLGEMGKVPIMFILSRKQFIFNMHNRVEHRHILLNVLGNFIVTARQTPGSDGEERGRGGAGALWAGPGGLGRGASIAEVRGHT